MSREIKFRAWENHLGRWYSPVYEAYKGQLEELNIGISGRLGLRTFDSFKDESLFKDRFTINQYTGLKDKNGVEIYEGDILKLADQWGDTSNHEVRWGGDYPAFEIYPGDDNWEANNLMTAVEGGDYETVEVMGNIYENKDLLNGQANTPTE